MVNDQSREQFFLEKMISLEEKALNILEKIDNRGSESHNLLSESRKLQGESLKIQGDSQKLLEKIIVSGDESLKLLSESLKIQIESQKLLEKLLKSQEVTNNYLIKRNNNTNSNIHIIMKKMELTPIKEEFEESEKFLHSKILSSNKSDTNNNTDNNYGEVKAKKVASFNKDNIKKKDKMKKSNSFENLLFHGDNTKMYSN